jgi:hypothetical protein
MATHVTSSTTVTRRFVPSSVGDNAFICSTPMKKTNHRTWTTSWTILTDQYSLREARPEKLFQFFSHRIVASIIDTPGRAPLAARLWKELNARAEGAKGS